jgi:hypothetical protein
VPRKRGVPKVFGHTEIPVVNSKNRPSKDVYSCGGITSRMEKKSLLLVLYTTVLFKFLKTCHGSLSPNKEKKK